MKKEIRKHQPTFPQHKFVITEILKEIIDDILHIPQQEQEDWIIIRKMKGKAKRKNTHTQNCGKYFIFLSQC